MDSSSGPPVDWLFFLDVMLVACFARLVSYPLYRLKIPRIIGDIIAGCLLGPTVLQGFADVLFPPENRPLLKIFGSFGLILASAISGAAFDRNVLKGMETKVAIFSVLNIGITFASVYLLLLFFPTGSKFHGPNYNEVAYSIYLGSVTCATSLPMVFLILDELKMTNLLAKFIIGAATLSTILLFTLASVANSFAYPPTGSFGSYLALFRIGVLVGIICLLWIVQRVWQLSLRKEWHRWFWRTSTDQSVLILTLCVTCAVATDQLGYTLILGAFLAGAFLPSPVIDPLGDESRAAMIRANFPKLVKYVSRWIMLPCYFLCIGLDFDIRYIGVDWGWVVLLLVWGMAFKMLLIPICRFGLGFSLNESCFLAFLGNCRGFNAIIIGAAAKDAGQFGDVTYATSVLFSVISSCLAGWLCQLFYRWERERQERLPQADAKGAPPDPEVPLHLAVAPFFGDNTGELLGAAQPSALAGGAEGEDGREHCHAGHHGQSRDLETCVDPGKMSPDTGSLEPLSLTVEGFKLSIEPRHVPRSFSGGTLNGRHDAQLELALSKGVTSVPDLQLHQCRGLGFTSSVPLQLDNVGKAAPFPGPNSLTVARSSHPA